jgi:ABC-type multidrug transport system ATPase subunit
VITADGLFKKYGSTTALDNARLNVKEGTIHGLIGPNGAGKSTTIKILSTLVRPDRGEVSIGDVPLKNGRAIRHQIGVVPETPRLHEYLTAREEITAYARISGMGKTQTAQRVSSVLEELDIRTVANQEISRYSTGMKKRVALALAMVTDPPVLLLDEPMAGLDPVVRRQFKDIILGLEDRTILVSDHDLFTVEELCSTVTILKEGRTLIENDIESLRKDVGKVSVELKPRDPGKIDDLASELKQMSRVSSIEVTRELVIASVTDLDADIPEVIRQASVYTDITEARPSKISLEEIFIKLATGGGRR